MKKVRKVTEVRSELTNAEHNLIERIGSVEYQMDTLLEKLKYGNFTPVTGGVPLHRELVKPKIKCRIGFSIADNVFTMSILGDNFSKPNILVNPSPPRYAYVAVYVYVTNLGWLPFFGFPKLNERIDTEGKFHVRTQIRGSLHIKIFARDNHTDEWANSIGRRIEADENGYGISEG